MYQRKDNKIRVTLLSRDTRYRRILNEDDLVAGLKKNTNYKVKRVSRLSNFFFNYILREKFF